MAENSNVSQYATARAHLGIAFAIIDRHGLLWCMLMTCIKAPLFLMSVLIHNACANKPPAKQSDAPPSSPGEPVVADAISDPAPASVVSKRRRVEFAGGRGHLMAVSELQFRLTTSGWDSRTMRLSWFDGGQGTAPGEPKRYGDREVTMRCTAWRPAASAITALLDNDAAWPSEAVAESNVRDPKTWPAVKCHAGDIGPEICKAELLTRDSLGWFPGPDRTESSCN